MHCPRCQHPSFIANGTCPKCGFRGGPVQLNELSQLNWLLKEMDTWVALGILENVAEGLQNYYANRYRNVQSSLGLHYEPFTSDEAEQAWPELRKYELLFQQIENWLRAGRLKSGFLPTSYARLLELRARMGHYAGPVYPKSDREHLDEINFLLDAVYDLKQRDDFISADARWNILSPLINEKSKLEKMLQPPKEIKAEVQPTPAPEPPVPEQPATPQSPPPPRPPLRERLWRSILSERTLQALLFLGIFLLFVAAISFVIWGWKDFSAPIRVAIPFGFTALFFGLGHFVRTRTQIQRSALALSAIASLLIPIDCYTIYANYGSPPNGWPEFWLITSLACLISYILAALQIQSRFFGYITGVAAGSTVLAILEASTDISRDWYTAALSVLAVGMILLGNWILRVSNPGRWRVFADPFRYMALWIPAVLLPLTLGLRLVTRNSFDALHYAMTIDWFLGGFIFAWGAIHHRSRNLGLLAAIALPVSVYMAQGAIFDYTGTNPAWHAFGLACLTPLYIYAGHRLSARKDDEVLSSHGKTATRLGVVLIVVSALFSLTDITSGTAAAATHAVLVLTTVLAAILWQKPRTLLAASFFSFTATTFAMSELNLAINQLGVGWISIAILHILLVLFLSRANQPIEKRIPFLIPLVLAAYVIGALAILPPILIYDGQLLSYALGNWVIISAWGAYLAYRKQPGFVPTSVVITEKPSLFKPLLVNGAIYHWLAALPFPFWILIVTKNNHAPEYILPFALAALAWLMVLLGHRLKTLDPEFRVPWRLTGLIVSVVAPLIAFMNASRGYTPSIVLLMIGILYFVDTFLIRDGTGFLPGGLITAVGMWLLLDHAKANPELITFALVILVSIYILGGLELERRKLANITVRFLLPLYATAHFIALVALTRVYVRPLAEFALDSQWTNSMQLWGAADQLLLALVYGAFAWGRYQELWGHLAAWLAMIGGGFIAIVYSEGHGSLAAKGAVIAVVMVLAERALFSWQQRTLLKSRMRAAVRLAWGLYHRPLLVAGWTASVGIIILSLVRNLILLGGGRIQQIWAAAGLLIITGLYVLSSYLFRKARFVWFAVIVLFAPWTILTHLGWFTSYKPTLPEFAISWIVLAWLLFLISIFIERRVPAAYITPLKTATQLLLPFSMLWAIADTPSSLFTIGLSIALYAVFAWMNHGSARRTVEQITPLWVTKFFYPALALIPLWSLYWLDYLSPSAKHEHFGIVLLAFGALGLLCGNRLETIAPRPVWKRAYGMPAYLIAYVTLITGILLVAHRTDLLAIALLYAAILMLLSAWMFKNPLWMYPMSVLMAFSLLAALKEGEVLVQRRGWWLIGLAAIYLLLAWVIRRIQLSKYASPLIAMAFIMITLGLPPSSLDKIGAEWGYAGAALLYAISAFWLQQPILLLPACTLIVVPYAAVLQQTTIPTQYYGLSLFPGAVLSLFLAVVLDRSKGAWKDFRWNSPNAWFDELTKRLFQWWALPLYILGFGFASAAPFFATGHSDLIALNFLLVALVYAWAVFRFRLRLWLVLAILSTHYALATYLDFFGFWKKPDAAWLRFLPLTAVLLLLALLIEKRFQEEPPLQINKLFYGWSRPFYLFVLIDIILSEFGSLRGTVAGTEVSVINAILIAILASAWRAQGLSYLTAVLGFLAMLQWRAAERLPAITLPTYLAALALGYGVIGFGYNLLHRAKNQQATDTSWHSVWEIPLQRTAMVLSVYAFGAGLLLGVDILGWSVRALFGLSFRQIVDLDTVFMVIWVLSLIGLLYVAAAVVYKRMRLAYLAVGMLLTGWFLYAFYVGELDALRQLQWYAIPAGLYLLAIGYLEWQRQNKNLARWLDYVAIMLMFGSLFWQTLVFGWQFALLLGSEGLIAFWWGSGRRLRRFFYAGMGGVILATLGQLLNALQEINQWITFGLLGLLLVMVAIVVERRLEAIKAWQQVLETWE